MRESKWLKSTYLDVLCICHSCKKYSEITVREIVEQETKLGTVNGLIRCLHCERKAMQPMSFRDIINLELEALE